MKKNLIINGSYRENGITDQMTEIAEHTLTQAGHQVEKLYLRNVAIRFCTNCRHCTQTSGKAVGTCIHNDKMAELITKIEMAETFVLAAPTNFGSVTAIFKRFMERLVVFGEWTWGQHAPKMRRSVKKKAILLSSCAAPAILARWQFDTVKQLKMTARVIGAKPLGNVVAGMIARHPNTQIGEPIKQKVRRLAIKLT